MLNSPMVSIVMAVRILVVMAAAATVLLGYSKKMENGKFFQVIVWQAFPVTKYWCTLLIAGCRDMWAHSSDGDRWDVMAYTYSLV
jgi:hypothetical protein